jgi:ketosteroid isomerase-like protein
MRRKRIRVVRGDTRPRQTINRGLIDDIEDAYKSGSPSYVELYDDSPIMTFVGRPPMTSKTAISGFCREFVEKYETDQNLTTEDIIEAGDWAVARNLYDLTSIPTAGGSPRRITGRNQLILKRQPDKSWKIARVIGNIEE